MDHSMSFAQFEKLAHCTKNEVSIKDFFSKCDQIRRKLRIWSHLVKKSLMENSIVCAVNSNNITNTLIDRFPNCHREI